MKAKSVNVEIVGATRDFVKVKLPFLEIPVKLNHNFFNSRLQEGYFKIRNNFKGQKYHDEKSGFYTHSSNDIYET